MVVNLEEAEVQVALVVPFKSMKLDPGFEVCFHREVASP